MKAASLFMCLLWSTLLAFACLPHKSYAVQLCGQFSSIQVMQTLPSNYAQNKPVIINNDIWNGVSSSQCLSANNADATWFVASSTNNKPTNGAPASYPYSQIGCHYGVCTANNPLPKQVSALNTLIVDWTTTWATRPTGNWNKSYDIWFDTNPTTPVGANAQELMIWFDKNGPIQPIGSLVAYYTTGTAPNTRTWEIWRDGFTTTYKYASGVLPPHAFNVKSIISDAAARGYISPSWYLISVQVGYEIWSGGVGLLTNIFSATIN